MPRSTRRSATLRLQSLENREVPAVITESFDASGGLPANWSQWSSGSPAYGPATVRTYSGAGALTSTATSNVSARAWATTAVGSDMSTSAYVFADSLIPTEVIARGQNLAGNTPSYYSAGVTRGANVTLARTVGGLRTVLGTLNTAAYTSGVWLKISVIAVGAQVAVELQNPTTGQFLNPAGQWQSAKTNAITVADSAISGAGLAGVARPAQYAGTVTLDSFEVTVPTVAPPTGGGGTTDPGTTTPVPLPTIPKHYQHIRIASLAYAGTPMTSTETTLLQNSVDLVVSNPGLLGTIDANAPNTPQLIYTNVSNIYQGLLVDWLNFADAKSQDREAAFYHVSRPTAFTGGSPSSIPVNNLWRVARGNTDLTSASRTGTTGDVSFGDTAGTVTYLGYPEEFGELNFNITSPKGGGWAATFEYVSAVDAAGNPTAWSTLPLISNSTANFTTSGRVRFDPPADWKTSLASGASRLYFVRMRVTSGGTSPVAATVLGRDYVSANGTQSGTIPVFDSKADANGDGYLNDAEYRTVSVKVAARFAYESRLFYPAYGQMRFAVNPEPQAVKNWAVDYHVRQIAATPLADGFFVDNANGRAPITADTPVVESTANYPIESGKLLQAVHTAIAPKWLMVNSSGGNAQTNEVISRTPAAMEEFALRPMATTWARFNDLSDLVNTRLSSSSSPYLVLDSHPQGGSPTDPRTQLATLAYYYTLSDADRTFLMFYGGFEPNTSWTRHWVPAAAFNIGTAQGKWTEFATGQDPANAGLTYKVISRSYSNGLVLYKPLSYKLGVGTGTLADNTATTHQLSRAYRVLNADGTLGATVTSITLRNGEGAILIPA
ncbi:MAG: hypothetical protein K1X57_11840 [Gemmataceae bacterium]|nr:hypothetical protein [Gemmataceae bacterium]